MTLLSRYRATRLAVVTLTAILAVGCVPPAFSQANFGRIEVQNNTPYALPASSLVGPSHPNAVLDIVVGLEWQNERQLNDQLARIQDPDSPDYRHFLTSAEFISQFAPSQADVDGVTQYLESQGLVVMEAASNRKLVHVRGKVSQVEQAFQVNINDYDSNGTRHFSNDRNPSLPSHIGAAVESVFGLSSFEVFNPNYRAQRIDSLLTSQLTYTPAQLATAYNFPNLNNAFHGITTYDGTGATIAIATAYAYTASDLDYFLQYFKINRTGSIGIISINGGSTTPNYETTLDIENAAAEATGADIFVYETPDSSFANFVLMYNQMASDNLAQVVSTSWVVCEANGGSFVKTADAIFKQESAQGMALFVGSGDEGAYAETISPTCSTASSSPAVDFPSSDPYFTAVGGTNLYLNTNGTYSSETAWTSSGGGISRFFAKPAWQKGPGVPTNTKRDLADVSFDASNNTGIYTYYQGVWYNGYGTSYGGPNWAALWALAIQARSGKRTGNADPTVYRIGANTANYKLDFFDVTTGNNGNGNGPGYNAKKNWDYPTGWGSPNGTNLVDYVKAH
jgi:kumamolisin